MEDDHDTSGFSAEGKVVEILERGGQRFARIVIEPGTVVEVPAAIDLNLGDRVMVDSRLQLHEVSAVPPGDTAHLRAAHPQEPPPEKPAWRDYEHVLRVATEVAATAEAPESFRPRIARARATLAQLKADTERRVLAALDDGDDS